MGELAAPTSKTNQILVSTLYATSHVRGMTFEGTIQTFVTGKPSRTMLKHAIA